MMKFKKNRGVATLPTVILLGLLTLAIVVSITSVAFNELLISQGSSNSALAISYAELGARDALTRIARDKTYKCDATNPCPVSGLAYYTIDDATNGCANNTACSTVTVSAGTGVTGDPKIIISKGIKGAAIRRDEVDVLFDGGTSDTSLQYGQITSTVWKELTD